MTSEDGRVAAGSARGARAACDLETGVLLLDAAGCVETMAGAAMRLAGEQRSRMLRPQVAQALGPLCLRLAEGGRSVSETLDAGLETELRLTASPRQDGRGYVVVIERDLTQRRRSPGLDALASAGLLATRVAAFEAMSRAIGSVVLFFDGDGRIIARWGGEDAVPELGGAIGDTGCALPPDARASLARVLAGGGAETAVIRAADGGRALLSCRPFGVAPGREDGAAMTLWALPAGDGDCGADGRGPSGAAAGDGAATEDPAASFLEAEMAAAIRRLGAALFAALRDGAAKACAAGVADTLSRLEDAVDAARAWRAAGAGDGGPRSAITLDRLAARIDEIWIARPVAHGSSLTVAVDPAGGGAAELEVERLEAALAAVLQVACGVADVTARVSVGWLGRTALELRVTLASRSGGVAAPDWPRHLRVSAAERLLRAGGGALRIGRDGAGGPEVTLSIPAQPASGDAASALRGRRAMLLGQRDADALTLEASLSGLGVSLMIEPRWDAACDLLRMHAFDFLIMDVARCERPPATLLRALRRDGWASARVATLAAIPHGTEPLLTRYLAHGFDAALGGGSDPAVLAETLSVIAPR